MYTIEVKLNIDAGKHVLALFFASVLSTSVFGLCG